MLSNEIKMNNKNNKIILIFRNLLLKSSQHIPAISLAFEVEKFIA